MPITIVGIVQNIITTIQREILIHKISFPRYATYTVLRSFSISTIYLKHEKERVDVFFMYKYLRIVA